MVIDLSETWHLDISRLVRESPALAQAIIVGGAAMDTLTAPPAVMTALLARGFLSRDLPGVMEGV
jgi:hypothetical protein